MLEHRVTGEADLAVDSHAGRARRCTDEPYSKVGLVLDDAVEPPKEVEVPPRSAQLSIGDAEQAELPLF